MELGAKIKFDDYWDVWRVPGGWIFAMDTGDKIMSQFVPFNNEFMSNN